MALIPLVFNPNSGSRRKDPNALLAGLDAEIRACIALVEMTLPFDYTEVIDRAERAGGPLIVWGGDGTIHHAAKALLQRGCPVSLAAIPGGSGNGLTGGLRTPENPAGALNNLIKGRELRMDVGHLDGTPFFNMAGCGFEGDVAHAFDESGKSGGGRGFFNYARITLKLWRGTQPLSVEWDAEGMAQLTQSQAATRLDKLRAAWRGPGPELPERTWSLCFANLPQYGSNLWIAPGADPTDGAMQWVSLSKPNTLDLITELPQLFRENGKTRLRCEGRLKRAVVRTDRPANWHIDGEPAPPRDRAEITLEPRAFRMMVIRGCPWG
jgi:diacylglycerol kinase family enzyme